MAALFSTGDWLVVATLGVTVINQLWRESKERRAKVASDAVDETTLHGVVKVLVEKVDTAIGEIRTLEDRRQKHEIECATIQATTAANQRRTAEILDEHTRSIRNLHAQMAHVASGAPDTLIKLEKRG